MKRAAILLSVIALGCLIAVGGGIAYSLIGSAENTASATQIWASRVLKSDVSVESTDVALGSGGIRLEGIRIDNPPGFTDAAAIEIETIRADGPLKRDISGTLVIPQIAVDGAIVTLETSAGAINIERLFKASIANALNNDLPHGSDLDRIEVGEILLLNSRIVLASESTRENPQATEMPDSRRRDIGANEPVSAADVAAHAMRLILIAGERATRRLQPTTSTELLAKAVENLEAAQQ